MVKAINWNNIDEKRKEIWERVTSAFWLDTKIPLSNDIPSWNTMSSEEKDVTIKIFGGLTLLDTLQSETGIEAISKGVKNQFDLAILSNFQFMETVHAKSYSSIFSTLCSTKEINDVFEWVNTNKFLQIKARIIEDIYEHSTSPLHKYAGSVLLETMLFYSGFYLPLYWQGAKGKLTNVADIIKLIIQDEAIHGYFIGMMFQEEFKKLSKDEQDKFQREFMIVMNNLYVNEIGFIYSLYETLGLSEDVIKFLNYNCNKALMNLGFDTLYSGSEIAVNPVVLAGLNYNETHDFFSSQGSSYETAKVIITDDEDWDF